MKFNLPLTVATLVHLNTRKEKHGEESVIAADLDIAVDIDAEEALKQLCVADYSPMLAALWVNDAQGQIREPSISLIRFSHKLENHTLRFTTDLEDAEGKNMIIATDVTLKKFRIEAKNGNMIHLRFQAQVNPTKNELARYADGLKQDSIRISIEQGPQMELAVDNTKEKETATA